MESGRWEKSSKMFVIHEFRGFNAAGVAGCQQVGVHQHGMHSVWPRGGGKRLPKWLAPFEHRAEVAICNFKFAPKLLPNNRHL